MPYHTEWIEPAILVKHEGVTVYFSYKNEDYQHPLLWWFTVDPLEDSDVFDVRELSDWDAERDWLNDRERVICRAIEKNEILPREKTDA